jgi:glycosyltransferase involved in cell wall biosynthesis
VSAFAARTRPDIAVVQCHGSVPLARAFRAAGVPVVLYLRNVEFDELGGDPATAGAGAFIANSRFTAGVYRDRFGIEAQVIPPTIDPARLAVDPDNSAVVFINPVADKGLDLALAIAALCPEIPFLFVESWRLSQDALEALRARIALLPNVTFERRKSDVREVYGRARVVLAPSQWAEAWGRVASEAQVSGLPVLGSDRGGLPEAIGPGGVVLPADAPAEIWADALRRIWSDPVHHATLSAAARSHAASPGMDAGRQFATFLGILRTALAGKDAAR